MKDGASMNANSFFLLTAEDFHGKKMFDFCCPISCSINNLYSCCLDLHKHIFVDF